jgi:pantoate--beta-alanine ligase
VLIFTKIAELQAFLHERRKSGQRIGFVPTMGALHQGHISLLKAAEKQCDTVICSIFVNPTQFNDKNDLERYPRTPEKDTEMLREAHCDALFMPEVIEMYPTAEKAVFDFGQLDKILEGKHRPGHFNGVAQIVKRFFEIVQPDMAFFGSKDYQQVMIVKALVKQMASGIEIVSCPILREPDGLAMSSRNMLLSSEERKLAGQIPLIMAGAKRELLQSGIPAARNFVKKQIELFPLMKLDYFEVCDQNTLEILSETAPPANFVMLIALFVGKIRLIDNLV